MENNNKYINNNDMEFEKLIQTESFVDFLNTIDYKGYLVTYNEIKFIIVMN